MPVRENLKDSTIIIGILDRLYIIYGSAAAAIPPAKR